MMKKTLLFLFLMSVSFAQSQELKQDNEQTKVTFKIKNIGFYVDGDFSDVNIQTNFNSQNLAESYINATIAIKSISTGNKSREKSLAKKDYFDEANYKILQLKSTKIEKNSDGTFSLHGELTIKATTKKIKIPLEVSESDSRVTIKSNFKINRKDYKVGGSSFVMSKTVKIQVEYSGTK